MLAWEKNNMDLKERIRALAIEELSKSDLRFSISNKSDKKVIQDLVSSEVLSRADIDSALETAIIKRAVRDYIFLFHAQQDESRRIYPDHDVNPQFLAYAIKNKKLPLGVYPDKIKFDQGETAYTFAEIYCPEDLIGNLRKELFSL